MAVNREVMELILDVTGFTRGSQQALDAAARLDARLSAVTSQSGRAGRGYDDLGRSSRNAGMGVLLLSQAIEDSQFGFRAVVNNIPGIVMGLGGGPGLAGAASLAAVGVNLLAQRWDSLQLALKGTALGNATSQIDGLFRGTMNALERLLAQVPGLGLATEEQKAQEARAAREAEEAAARRKKAIEDVVRVGQEGNDVLARAAQEAAAKVGGGQTILDVVFNRMLGDRKDLQGNSEKAVKGREMLRGQVATMIQGVLSGQGGNAQLLDKELRGTGFVQAFGDAVLKMLDDGLKVTAQQADQLVGAFAGTPFARRLTEALVPIREEHMRERATKYLKTLAGIFDRVANAGDFTLPDLTGRQKEKMAAGLQERLEALGISPEVQQQIAGLLSGKGAQGRLAQLNTVLPMLQQGGATEREMFEALPRIFRDQDAGRNLFASIQGALNDLSRGGLAAGLQGAGRSMPQIQAEQGLALLGLTPDVMGGQTSRFRRSDRSMLGKMDPKAARRMGLDAAPPPQDIPGQPAAVPGWGPEVRGPEGANLEQLRALRQAHDFGDRQAAGAGEARARAQAMIEQQRQREAEAAARVQAEIIANQAKTGGALRMLEANLRNARVVGQQIEQQGRTAQNRGR